MASCFLLVSQNEFGLAITHFNDNKFFNAITLKTTAKEDHITYYANFLINLVSNAPLYDKILVFKVCQNQQYQEVRFVPSFERSLASQTMAYLIFLPLAAL